LQVGQYFCPRLAVPVCPNGHPHRGQKYCPTCKARVWPKRRE